MRKQIKLPIALLLSLNVSILSAQLTSTVCASGCDYETIQAAINAAPIGGFISILDAVHTEHSININKDIIICGGSSGTTVQATNNPGTGNFRIFNIGNGASVAINDLVLRNGNVQSNLLGGAIFNDGDLALVNCTLTDNHAHRGGAIASTGTLGLVDCTVSNNSVSDRGSDLASGGGIYAGGSIALVNTTISGNSNNTGGNGDGGGITVLNGAFVGLYHTTIAYNTIGVNGEGAGFSAQPGSILDLVNNIIANNTGAEDFYNQGTLTAATNLTNIIPSCTENCPTFITADPVLLPLADNGGCTQTHYLGEGSAAIDAATVLPPVAFVSVDQRGADRDPLAPDIGAVEETETTPICMVSLLCEDLLPVELISFSAQAVEQSVVLDWVTSVELNNEGFAVERSGDGVSWTQLAFVAGQGTSSEVNTYNYIDLSPLSGTNYYRLKQLDFDGQWEYSDLRSIDFIASAQHKIQLFPNPASESVTVQLPDNGRGYRLALSNTLGQIVWETQTTVERSQKIWFSDHQLAPGIYWLKATPIGGSTVQSQTFRLQVLRP